MSERNLSRAPTCTFFFLGAMLVGCGDDASRGKGQETDASEESSMDAYDAAPPEAEAGQGRDGGSGSAPAREAGVVVVDAGAPSPGSAGPDARAAEDSARPTPPADASTVAPTGPGAWSMGMVMPTKRTELAVAELGGKVYVAGGFGGTSTFEAYDPAADRWERLADLPEPREHPSLGALEGRIYMTGGTSADTFVYDPAMNRWSPRAPLLYARYASAAVALDGALYLVGGTGDSPTTMQRYDPAADAWTASAQLSVVRDHVAAVVLDGKIYALAGRAGREEVYTSIEIYDPALGKFMPGPDMQESRSGFGAAVIGGKIYVAGGEVLVQPYFVRDTVEMFDPATQRWSHKAKLPGPLHGIGAAAFAGRMYVFGGASTPASATPRLGGVNIFTP